MISKAFMLSSGLGCTRLGVAFSFLGSLPRCSLVYLSLQGVWFARVPVRLKFLKNLPFHPPAPDGWILSEDRSTPPIKEECWKVEAIFTAHCLGLIGVKWNYNACFFFFLMNKTLINAYSNRLSQVWTAGIFRETVFFFLWNRLAVIGYVATWPLLNAMRDLLLLNH